jgi:Lrp/AsnC family transcriptional regulator, leucine-responsive regulatory protein
MKLDETDRKILETIQNDGRITNTKLASLIGISQPAMLERVRRLEASGVISGYTAILNREKIGLGVMVFVTVSLALHQLSSVDKIKKKILNFPEVLECYQVSGDNDFILKVALENINCYLDFVMNKLSKVAGVRKVNSSFVLDTVKNTNNFSLESAVGRTV